MDYRLTSVETPQEPQPAPLNNNPAPAPRGSKNTVIVVLSVLLVLSVLVLGAVLIIQQQPTEDTVQSEPVACTEDARVCPDGSSVARVAPDCEFAECPDVTAGWKTYRNEVLGFEVKYPKDLVAEENLFSTNFGMIFCPLDSIEVRPDGSSGCEIKLAMKGDYEGVIFYLFTYNDNNAKSDSYHYLGQNPSDGKYYYMFLHPNNVSGYKNVLNKIIPTFKFIDNVPKINNINLTDGRVGAIIEITGSGFSGFEGDLNVWIENSQGEKGIIYGQPSSTDSLIKIILPEKVCTIDTSYSGLPCPKQISLIPGDYKIYISSFGNQSNKIDFKITN